MIGRDSEIPQRRSTKPRIRPSVRRQQPRDSHTEDGKTPIQNQPWLQNKGYGVFFNGLLGHETKKR